jgi:integrase/recombinase XerD|tara:strand:+ start:160 stop:639 length:480 start_codon:yes stop_codon:yes gene_type:complete
MKAGLRAKEIATLQWRHVCDAEGALCDEITIEDKGSKGNGGRLVPMNKELQAELTKLQAERSPKATDAVFYSERKRGNVSPQTVVDFFKDLYSEKNTNLEGASSHSGRRTFITNAAKKITTVGGSLRDVQHLAGHSSLQTTQRYIESDAAAKKAIVDIV